MVFSSLPITRGPGTRDSRPQVTALVTDGVAVVPPGPRGLDESGKRMPGIAGVCNAAAQARGVAGLIGELGAATAPLAPRWWPHEASAELFNAVLPG